MTEKKFFNFILFEGILLSILGTCLLILPKISSITIGILICISFIVYGTYKIINAIIARHYIKHFILNIILGLLLIGLGSFLFIAPMFNLLIITSFVAIYFILESLSNIAFSIQNRKKFDFWWLNILVAFLQFFIGLIIIISLPNTALWLIGTLAGINFLIAGMSFITIFISTKNLYN